MSATGHQLRRRLQANNGEPVAIEPKQETVYKQEVEKAEKVEKPKAEKPTK